MTARLAQRTALLSIAVVLWTALALMAPTAAHARSVPLVQKGSAATHQVVSDVQKTMRGEPPVRLLTH